MAAIAGAAVAGIISLPALLGSDRPPPVPQDVGLTPPAASASFPPAVEAQTSPPPAPKPDRPQRRMVVGEKRRERPQPRRERVHPRREESHPRRQHRGPKTDRTPAAPSPPAYTPPPVYSYVPPPSSGEFHIER